MVIAGIDPGHTGAIAFIDTDLHTVSVIDMPIKKFGSTKVRREVAGPLLAKIIREGNPDVCYLEEVWSSQSQQSVNAFTFGDGYGTIKGVLAAYGIELFKVRPQLWKKTTKTPKNKNEARYRAMECIPSIKEILSRAKDDGRAEAAMIALYGVFDQSQPLVKPLKMKSL